MDFGALPPEINSARMYAGPGSGSMLAAAAGWNVLAGELHSAASSYTSVISGLTSGPWLGPSSTAMAGAAAPYVAWMTATAGQAEQAASQAQAAAGAYETAFAMTVPPPVIAANRAQLMMLVATNLLGQNTPAIAATEAQYGEMWAQDAAAMYGYAANSAAATQVTPFTAAPQTTNLAGLAAQQTAGAQAAGASTGTGVQSTLSQLVSTLPTTLQSLASPGASTSSASGVPGILGGSSLTDLSNQLSTALPGFSVGGILTGLITDYGYLPGFMATFLANDAIAPAFSVLTSQAMTPALAGGAAAAPLVGGGAAAAEGAALGSGFGGGLGGFSGFGGLAGLGQAPAVGGLSVPPVWGWAATAPPGLLGGIPFAPPGANLGAIGGLPIAAGLPMTGGLPGTAAASKSGTTAAGKYGPRLAVVARPPAAGYSPVPLSSPTLPYPVPAGFPQPGPGYAPHIVYLPTNGHAPAGA